MGRLGWTNAEGTAAAVKLIRHSKPTTFGPSSLRWEMADQEDVERLAKAKIKPSKAEKRIPQDGEILAWFPTETDGDNPDRWLLTTEELKLKFKENGFSKNDLAALMDRLVKEGRVELIKKRKNAKFYALPEIAKEYHRATASVVQLSSGTTRTTG